MRTKNKAPVQKDLGYSFFLVLNVIQNYRTTSHKMNSML